ncbi:hypothetical protein NKDENANG_01340 [Candidatus Entotheonellaceae bacterium PAL068K]
MPASSGTLRPLPRKWRRRWYNSKLIYRLLGEHLLGLTADRDFILDASTYQQRSTNSGRLPGVFVEDVSFTL